MKARVKSNGKIVEVVSRFMPRKRNVPSRDWVCNLADGTCIDESQLEYIDESIKGLDKAATISLDEANALSNEYVDYLVKGLTENQPRPIGPKWFIEYAKKRFIAGAKWMKAQMMKEAVEGVVTDADGVFGYDVAAFRFDDNHTYSILLPHEEKRKYGDKVCVIFLPKEDEK